MTERLKEIAEHLATIRPDSVFSLSQDECRWLVTRVKRLTEALERIADGRAGHFAAGYASQALEDKK